MYCFTQFLSLKDCFLPSFLNKLLSVKLFLRRISVWNVFTLYFAVIFMFSVYLSVVSSFTIYVRVNFCSTVNLNCDLFFCTLYQSMSVHNCIYNTRYLNLPWSEIHFYISHEPSYNAKVAGLSPAVVTWWWVVCP